MLSYDQKELFVNKHEFIMIEGHNYSIRRGHTPQAGDCLGPISIPWGSLGGGEIVFFQQRHKTMLDFNIL